MTKALALHVIAGGAIAMTVCGCGGGKKHRATLGFSCEAVRSCIERVEEQVPKREQFPMRAATDQLLRALDGLPKRVKTKATTRVEERAEAATKAAQLFRGLEPVLNSLKYDEAEVKARLQELSRLIDEVERA